jgi:hypothetical protein
MTIEQLNLKALSNLLESHPTLAERLFRTLNHQTAEWMKSALRTGSDHLSSSKSMRCVPVHL